MKAIWPSRYLSIPFLDRGESFQGADCYGLLRLILRQEAGIEIPAHSDIAPGESLSKARRIGEATRSGLWVDVDAGKEKAFDGVLMRSQIEHGGRVHSRPVHVGIVVEPGWLIHAEEGRGVTVAEYRRHFAVRSRVCGFLRWRESG